MDFYSVTCGLTNLPINIGDEVVVFLLKEKSLSELKGGQFSYIDDLFVPLTPPIHGKYDGYGSVTDTEHRYDNLVLKQIKSFFEEKEGLEPLSIKEGSSSINIKEATLGDLIYEFERGNIIQKANEQTLEIYKESGEVHRGYYYTGIVMFHKKAFDSLVTMLKDKDLTEEHLKLATSFSEVDFRKEMSKEMFNTLVDKIVVESRAPRSKARLFDLYMYWYQDTHNISVNDDLIEYIKSALAISEVLTLLNKAWMPQVSSSNIDDSKEMFAELGRCINEILYPPMIEEIVDEVEDVIVLENVFEELDVIKDMKSRFNLI